MRKHIRNFSIIAHIDHGKSTLSDRIIQFCGGLHTREMRAQVLDSMDLERERGITIKSQTAMLNYVSKIDGNSYKLNLIDTPGHVDFSYEVSRSLAACEGAILVIDVTQGVEAQTIANYRIAMEMCLKIIVVLNKVDVLMNDDTRVFRDIKDIVTMSNTDRIIRCSAKTGFGVSELLERVVSDIPCPKGDEHAPLQALIIDSWFNNYLGVVSLICIKNGILRQGDILKSMSTGYVYIVKKVGIFTPKQIYRETLNCGEVGWIVYIVKNKVGAVVGDTLTLLNRSASASCPGFKKIQHYVYAGLFPINSKNYKCFVSAVYKLSLNDASLFYEPENSEFLGLGFRCGFLGLLHMEIVQERLKREYLVDLIVTAPMVVYEVLTVDNQIMSINNPSKILSLTHIKEIREPIALCNFLLPMQYLGDVISLCIEKRGTQVSMEYYGSQVKLTYTLPMSEIMLDFFDRIKSMSRGYASFEYAFHHFQPAKIVCIEILINKKRIDALSILVHYDKAIHCGHMLVNKLQSLIPRQQFDVVIQAIMGNQVISKGVVKQLRKDVLAKCYGGDVTRKKKLLYNQKRGKKRMRKVGNISLPNTVFLSILNINNNK